MRRPILPVLVASSLLHAVILGIAWREDWIPDAELAAGVVDAEGDDDDLDDADGGELEGTALVSVSVVVDPVPAPPMAPQVTKAAPKPKKARPVEGAVVPPATPPEDVAVVVPPPEVEPPVVVEAPPLPVEEEIVVDAEDLPDEDPVADDPAAPEITTDDQGDALPTLDEERLQSVRARHEARAKLRAARKAAKVDPKTCAVDPDDGVARVSPWSWRVERDVVDFYATHLKELLKLGTVQIHKDKRGKPDGFQVTLRKCSLLKLTGLQSGDVVQDINGIKVKDLFGAVRAYFKLRKEDHIVVRLERKGAPLTMAYELTEEDVDHTRPHPTPGHGPGRLPARRVGVKR